MKARRAVAWALFVVAAAWLVVLLAAALTGGWHLGPISITSHRPLRFALLTLFAGWFLLPREERVALAARVPPRRLLVGALAFAALYGVAFRVSRWLSFEGAAFDLSLFESTLHHTLQGQFMYAWGLNRSLFSEHFEPIVLLHLPVWALFRHPMVLLLSQSFAITFAVVPLYRSVRALGLEARFAALAAAAYLFNPIVWQANRIDFHPELFAPLALFWALHASLTRRWVSLYLALAFALLLKEELALVMLCFSVLVLKGPGERRWPHALAVAIASVLWGVIAFKWVMPASHPAGAELHPLAGRWAHLGSTYPEMAVGMLTRPGWLLGLLFSEPPLTLFASLGFVPLLDPVSFLAAMPPLFLHLTGTYEFAARLGAYYGLLPTCLLFIGLVFGLERAHRKWGERAALFAGVLAVVSMPAWVFLSRPTAADLHALAFMREIPAGDVVCAQSPLAPHRTPDVKTLQMIPYCESPQWMLFAREHDRWPLQDRAEYDAYVTQQLEQGFVVAFSEGDYVFMKRAP